MSIWSVLLSIWSVLLAIISFAISLAVVFIFRKYAFRATNPAALVIDIVVIIFITTSIYTFFDVGKSRHAPPQPKITTDPVVVERIRLDAERNNLGKDWDNARIWNAYNGDEVYCRFTNTTAHPIWVVLDGQPRTIQIGQGPVSLPGRLEVKIANQYEKRFVAVKSTDGFLARTLIVSIPTPEGSYERKVTKTDRMSVEQNPLPPTHRQNSEAAIAGITLQPSMPPLTKIGRFPETQHNLLTDDDLRQMTSDDLRYAINEMYARHGAWFNNAEVRANFTGFSWYRPVKGMSFDQIENSFSPLEAANLRILSERREQFVKLPSERKLATASDKSQRKTNRPTAQKSIPRLSPRKPLSENAETWRDAAESFESR